MELPAQSRHLGAQVVVGERGASRGNEGGVGAAAVVQDLQQGLGFGSVGHFSLPFGHDRGCAHRAGKVGGYMASGAPAMAARSSRV